MKPASRKLVALHVSPWSERAKWALDHHGLDYEVVPHMPVIGERRLRKLVGPSKARATVPVLIDGDEVFSESWDIALHADRVGKGTKLIPPEHEAAIQKWTALADAAMNSGRALIIAAMLASPRALDEGAPPGVPAFLRPALRPVTRAATRAFGRKYGVRLDALDEHERAMRKALDALRAGVQSGGAYLQGSFTYADIVMATLLQGISPVADRFIRLGPATRAAWTRDALARDFADLIAWRDRVYEEQRKRAP